MPDNYDENRYVVKWMVTTLNTRNGTNTVEAIKKRVSHGELQV